LPEKEKAILFYIIAIPLAVAAAFLLYFNGLFNLFIPLAILVIAILCVFIWKREKKKDKDRIERMYTEGLLRRPAEKPAVIDYAVLPEIAAVISSGDSAVVNNIAECVKDHAAYFENHREEYENRGIDSVDNKDKEEMCWLCMVDQLMDNNYAVEIDWKAETEDILYNLDFIVRKLRLPLDIDSLNINDERIERIRLENDDDDPITWVALYEISSALKAKDYAFGCIDIDSDSYVLFIAEENQDIKENLVNLAVRYGRRIGFNFQRHLGGVTTMPF